MTPSHHSYFLFLIIFLISFRASSWELNRHHLKSLNASWSPLALTVCLLMTTQTHLLQMNTFNQKLSRKSHKSVYSPLIISSTISHSSSAPCSDKNEGNTHVRLAVLTDSFVRFLTMTESKCIRSQTTGPRLGCLWCTRVASRAELHQNLKSPRV